jgi:hypothetical protein
VAIFIGRIHHLGHLKEANVKAMKQNNIFTIKIFVLACPFIKAGLSDDDPSCRS